MPTHHDESPSSGSSTPTGSPTASDRTAIWGPLIGGLLIAFVMVVIMATNYVWANHALVAHNLPWGQVGNSSLTDAVSQEMDLKITQYASQADLEQAANEAKIYGGFVADSNTLIINEAASLWAPGVIPLAYEKAAKQSGDQIQLRVINTLPSEDPEGAVPGLVLFVLLVAGYLSSTFAMQRTKTAAAPRRVAALFAFAVVAALAINLIVGPLLNAYPNVWSNFWWLWLEFTLVIFATAMLAAVLQSLLGLIGTLLTVVIIIFFGNPSTGGVNGVAYLPPFWQAIGVVLPPRSGLYLIRNTLYFGGNQILWPIITLLIYAVLGVIIVTILSWGRLRWWKARPRRPEPLDPDDEIGAAAIPPG